LESEIISERARLGLNGLAKAHKWPNDHPPLGFERTKSGHLKIIPKESRLVRKIFRMYLQTKSMGQVAFKLNKLNILTKKGLKWTASAVRAILVNKIYVGFYNVAGVKDYVEEYRIVEDNVFEKVNALRLRYRSKNSARPEMPKDRKKVKVEKMFGTYLQLLKEAKH
jgi:site-specific DNA recombinase